MIDVLTKKLEELNKQKETHEASLARLSSAKEKSIAILNSIAGAIEVIEDLLKELNKESDKN